jgi:hypothetical protein
MAAPFRDIFPYALETDWPAEAGGFEPPDLRIGIRQDSQLGRQDSNFRISIPKVVGPRS